MASKENRSEAMVSGADGINQGENLDPIGEGLDDHHGNLDQGLSSAMVLFKKKLTDGEEEDDDVLDVDLGEEVEEMKSKWLIIARFYSGQRERLGSLGDNRFLVEFACEADYNRVVYGGPWKHKGDALLVVPYDGLARPSEICIESLPLWLRIYDLPEIMMTTGFARSLGGKIGEVLEVGGAIHDFLRVKVAFPLSSPLKPLLRIWIKDKGVMSFPVKYENVPFFCFSCGRIGHAERECPEVGSSSAQVRFGKELRASPLKRKLQSFAPSSISTPKAAKVLNFSGAQREKVLTASSSSKASVLSNPKLNSGGATMFLVGEKADQEEKAASVEAEASLYPLPKGITAALEEGVSQMKMQLDDGELNLAARGPCSRERVSMSSDYGLSGEETPQHSAGIVSGVVNQDVKSPGGQSKKKQWVPTRETDRAVKAKSLSIGRDIGKPRKITIREQLPWWALTASPTRNNECSSLELVRLVRMYSPRLVFLSATRQDQERVQGLRWRLGLKNCLALKGEGSGGGVALIWDETLSVHLLSMSCRYIDVLISEANSGFQWRGTFVYGEPRMQDRHLPMLPSW
ncbi:hypothetical protein DAI22_01g209766 [Oryza sativa Japonica Group]|nr:hypothetical protein DAI22_01g209766 [Oryza sativa Japonica Group]